MKTKISVLFFAILLWMGFVAFALAQIWHTANQATIAWDAVTTLENGDPLPADSTIQYRVLLADAINDPTKTNPTDLGVVSGTQFTVSFVSEGKYFVGVKTERLVNSEVVSVSPIAWTDDAQYCQNGETFGFMFYHNPAVPSGLRKQ